MVIFNILPSVQNTEQSTDTYYYDFVAKSIGSNLKEVKLTDLPNLKELKQGIIPSDGILKVSLPITSNNGRIFLNDVTELNLPNIITFGSLEAKDLQVLNVPSATSFSEYAFLWGNSKVQKIYAPKVEQMGMYAMVGCNSIKYVYFPSLKATSDLSLSCAALECAILPNITYIAERTFGNDKNLKTVILGENLKTINKTTYSTTFSDCNQSDLKIVIDQAKDTISGAPWGASNATIYWTKDPCYYLPSYLEDVNKIDDYKFNYYNSKTLSEDVDIKAKSLAITKVVIPPNINSIGKSAFCLATNLVDVIVLHTNNLKIIEQKAFLGCSSLKPFDTSTIEEIDDHGFGTCYKFAPTNFDNLKILGDGAFSDSGLEEEPDQETLALWNCDTVVDKINFPKLVTVGNESLVRMPRYVKQIDLPLVEETGDFIFFNQIPQLSVLQTVNMPSIKNIKRGCFYGIPTLTNVNIGNKIETINSEAFDNLSGTNLTITINKSTNSIPGAPWGATNAKIVWNGQ